MRKSINPNPVRAIIGVFLTAFILLTTSCSEASTPTIKHTPSILPTEQVTDWPTSAKKISPDQHLRFETISLEQGLSQSTVFCMLQDSQGFMWFGTEDGLNKYDGYTFTIYKHDHEEPNSVSNNWISAMLEDASGTLWIGTIEGGLDRYDQKLDQFTHYQNNPADPSSLSNNEITAIYQDQDSILWIGTSNGGLDQFDQENEQFMHYHFDPDDPNTISSNAVSAIYEDQKGMLWIGTQDGGLNKFDREINRWWHYKNDPSDPHSLSHDNITAISGDTTGILWIGTSGGGLVRYDPENEQFIQYRHDPDDSKSLSSDEITAIYHDWEGILWIGTLGGGLNMFDPEKETFAHYKNVPSDPHSLSSDIVVSIFKNREGVLWIGTRGVGISKLGVGRWNFAHFKNDPNNPNSLGDNMVWALFQDQENILWVGTMLGGLDRFDRGTGTWRHYPHNPDDPGSLSDNWVWSIYEDDSGVLWIGTRGGLDRFDPQTETFTHYQANPNSSPGSSGNKVTAIKEGPEGNFWIGTEGGLYRFDREKESWSQPNRYDSGYPKSLGNGFITVFLEDREGMLWIGTLYGGLSIYNPEKDVFSHYQNDPDDPQSLVSNSVLTLFQDREDVLWIGTLDGLDRFDPGTETFIHFPEKSGLPNEVIYSILEDGQGNLWLTTNKGLSRLDPKRESVRNYDVSDGLQSNEFNARAHHMSDSGEMFFGGINGFNVFFPDQVTVNPTIPPIILTSLTQDGDDVDLGIAVDSLTEVGFKWPNNSFEFEFTALSYAQPEKNQYAYYLDGFDDTWHEVGTRRYGQYTNLPGGSYILRVKGSNNDGVWNEVGTSIEITIVPPFWQTGWFIGIMILALTGLIFGGFRLRVRNLEEQGRTLEFQVEQRTAELMKTQETLRQREMEKAITAERNRLARDLHDSVTQALYSQTLYAEATSRLLAAGDIQTATEHVGELQQTAQQALQEMRLLIFELRPSVLEDEGIVTALQTRLESVEKRSGFTTEFKIEGMIELPSNIEQGLYWISQEVLNNIVKHAQASKVTVILKQEQQAITLDICDDGVGFDPVEQLNQGGLGLRGIHERAVQMAGKITIESQPGKGTRVRVEVSL